MVPALLAFPALVGTHWIADFLLQTHWQGINKSKSNVALSHHVLTYTSCIGAMSFLILALPQSRLAWLAFIAINGTLHFATDYVSSRCSARLRTMPARLVRAGLDQLIHHLTLAATLWLAFYR